jgi:UDP-N-acetylmuramoylalanine--D-glutamate ligase
LCWFSRKKRVAVGAFLLNDDILFRNEGFEVELAKRSHIALRGEHNLENVLAACAASYLAGATPAAIASGVKTFKAVEHRLEFVAEIGGVSFFNDSKATNVDAAVKAIEAFPGKLRVILGGKDKGSPYTPLAPLLKERARQILLIGAAAGKIAEELAEIGTIVPIERADTLDRAVHLAYASAEAGDTVLLARANIQANRSAARGRIVGRSGRSCDAASGKRISSKRVKGSRCPEACNRTGNCLA